jgi:FkbM family methyltransferase
MAISDLLAVAALIVAALAALPAVLAFVRLRAAHARIHQLERRNDDLQRALTSLARSALAFEAQRRGVNGDVARGWSQHGEELLLWERLGFPKDGVFVEIGAYDGVRFSNSLFFERIGWKGVLVEAHPELAERCRASRPGSIVVHAALGPEDGGTTTFSMVRGGGGVDTLSFAATSERHRARVQARGGRVERVAVPARSLRAILQELRIDHVDWMSIDVEGGELEVLKGAGLERVRPRLLLIEDNSGGTDPAIGAYLARFGYRRELTIGCNDLYARPE